jgi:hypothetical protein
MIVQADVREIPLFPLVTPDRKPMAARDFICVMRIKVSRRYFLISPIS